MNPNQKPLRGRAAAVETLEMRRLFQASDSILHDFAGRPDDGSVPNEGLVLLGSRLYGVSQYGGPNDDGSGGGPGLGHKGGTLFAVNTDGSNYQVLHTFGGTLVGNIRDGYEPLANLTAFNGKLFGTTPFGGPADAGTVFSINADGSGYLLLHAFGNPNDSTHQYDDGANPFYAPLVPVNGKLYGIATTGGRPVDQGSGAGVLFSINPDTLEYSKVHVFDLGTNVAVYNLGLATDGTTFYGMTGAGGPTNAGTIYSIGVDGSNFQIIHNIDNTTEGFDPLNALTLVNGNELIGTTASGGPSGGGTLFTLNTDGSNFQIRHNFNANALINNDGLFPNGTLLQVDNKIYGTATTGGPGFDPIAMFSPVGTVFSVDLDGTNYQNALTFNGLVVNNKHDGASPYGQLVSDGTKIYGVTGGGGVNNIGTIYSFSPNGGSNGGGGGDGGGNGGGGGGGGGAGSGDLVVQIAGAVPASTIGGIGKAKLKLKLVNQGAGIVTGDSTVSLLLSSDEIASDDDATLLSIPAARLNLKPGKSKSLPASFVFPSGVNDGSYRILAVADPGNVIAESDETNNTTATTPIELAKPFVNLTAVLKPASLKQNKSGTLSLSVMNTGNVPATKFSTPLRVIVSPDGQFDDNGETTLLDTTTLLTIKAGKSKNVKLKLAPLTLLPGTFATEVLIDPDSVTADTDRNDNTAAAAINVV